MWLQGLGLIESPAHMCLWLITCVLCWGNELNQFLTMELSMKLQGQSWCLIVSLAHSGRAVSNKIPYVVFLHTNPTCEDLLSTSNRLDSLRCSPSSSLPLCVRTRLFAWLTWCECCWRIRCNSRRLNQTINYIFLVVCTVAMLGGVVQKAWGKHWYLVLSEESLCAGSVWVSSLGTKFTCPCETKSCICSN